MGRDVVIPVLVLVMVLALAMAAAEAASWLALHWPEVLGIR